MTPEKMELACSLIGILIGFWVLTKIWDDKGFTHTFLKGAVLISAITFDLARLGYIG